MAKPVALFDFKANGLSVNFYDKSSNSPTTWQWAFGGGQAQSNIQNPVNIGYFTPGVYTVTLTASNADGADIFKYDIVLSSTPGMNSTIAEMINEWLLPGSVTPIQLSQLIRKWQLYIQPMVPSVSVADTFDESKWPSMVNLLISQVILVDKVYQGFGKTLLTSIAQGKGGLKRLETGPSNAEWFDPNTMITGILKNEGIFAGYLSGTCGLAQRLNITLPFCPMIPVVRPFVNAKRSWPWNHW